MVTPCASIEWKKAVKRKDSCFFASSRSRGCRVAKNTEHVGGVLQPVRDAFTLGEGPGDERLDLRGDGVDGLVRGVVEQSQQASPAAVATRFPESVPAW